MICSLREHIQSLISITLRSLKEERMQPGLATWSWKIKIKQIRMLGGQIFLNYLLFSRFKRPLKIIKAAFRTTLTLLLLNL